jgi:hypothetical protein
VGGGIGFGPGGTVGGPPDTTFPRPPTPPTLFTLTILLPIEPDPKPSIPEPNPIVPEPSPPPPNLKIFILKLY